MSRQTGQKWQMSGCWFCAVALAGAFVVLLSGCGAVLEEPLSVCEGKENVVEAVAALASRRQGADAFRANGQCLLQYHDADGHVQNENFPVKVWVEPPDKICLYGDKAFDARAIVLGSNQREFWLAVRPKKVSSYWWGRWPGPDGQSAMEACPGQLSLPLNPLSLLEAVGLIEAGTEQQGGDNWQLSNAGGFDILTKVDSSAGVAKKIHISCRDYLVRRIEYFSQGRVVTVTELGEYRKVSDDFLVPMMIRIVQPVGGGKRDSVRITLSSARAKPLSEKQRRFLFTRPAVKRFEHIYRLNENCEFIEQR